MTRINANHLLPFRVLPFAFIRVIRGQINDEGLAERFMTLT